LSLSSLIQTRGLNARVYRATYKVDGVGTRKKTFVPRPNMKMYVAARTSDERWDGDRQVVVELATLYVDGGSDIVATDRVEIEGIMFEVTGKRTPGHRKAGDRHFYHVLTASSNASL
tara:strand:- start:221 stop:571 length:351 start_codon:yes stop_codon:yes gene_type:complete